MPQGQNPFVTPRLGCGAGGGSEGPSGFLTEIQPPQPHSTPSEPEKGRQKGSDLYCLIYFADVGFLLLFPRHALPWVVTAVHGLLCPHLSVFYICVLLVEIKLTIFLKVKAE